MLHPSVTGTNIHAPVFVPRAPLRTLQVPSDASHRSSVTHPQRRPQIATSLAGAEENEPAEKKDSRGRKMSMDPNAKASGGGGASYRDSKIPPTTFVDAIKDLLEEDKTKGKKFSEEKLKVQQTLERFTCTSLHIFDFFAQVHDATFTKDWPPLQKVLEKWWRFVTDRHPVVPERKPIVSQKFLGAVDLFLQECPEQDDEWYYLAIDNILKKKISCQIALMESLEESNVARSALIKMLDIVQERGKVFDALRQYSTVVLNKRQKNGRQQNGGQQSSMEESSVRQKVIEIVAKTCDKEMVERMKLSVTDTEWQELCMGSVSDGAAAEDRLYAVSAMPLMLATTNTMAHRTNRGESSVSLFLEGIPESRRGILLHASPVSTNLFHLIAKHCTLGPERWFFEPERGELLNVGLLSKEEKFERIPALVAIRSGCFSFATRLFAVALERNVAGATIETAIGNDGLNALGLAVQFCNSKNGGGYKSLAALSRSDVLKGLRSVLESATNVESAETLMFSTSSPENAFDASWRTEGVECSEEFLRFLLLSKDVRPPELDTFRIEDHVEKYREIVQSFVCGGDGGPNQSLLATRSKEWFGFSILFPGAGSATRDQWIDFCPPDMPLSDEILRIVMASEEDNDT